MMFLWDVFLAAFFYVLLRAVQQLNVVHGLYWAIFPVSFGMAATDIAIVLWVAHDYGWDSWFSLGFGGALGACAGVWGHKRFRSR